MGRLLIAVLLLASCSRPDLGNTRVIGHAGMGPDGEHAMNSRGSLLEALALGADGIEVDAQLTADSVLVAYHPADLAELTACMGKVNALTYQQLRNCAYQEGQRSAAFFRLDSLLLEAARLYPHADFTLDCKLFAHGEWWPYLHAFSDAITHLDDDSLMNGRVLVDCQTEDFLRLLHEKRPGFGTFYYASSFDGAVDKAIQLGCKGITLAHDRVSQDEILAAQRQGLVVTLFGTSGAWAHRSALGKQPDRLQTDDLRHALSLRTNANR
ncbi:MAG TPA: glycerophosphodiester phosphodiesterase family protein [Flavobacteriales bacterium]|nr:glycerophosphodiester phosphodiesterase family protein [Flavobacteriales bacterium]